MAAPPTAVFTTWSFRLALAGVVDTLTFVPSVFVLGVIFGASSGSTGIGPLAAVAMSATVFSGASQFAALPLWQQGRWLVLLTTLALSLRFSLMAASLAPSLAGRPRWLRAVLAFMLTDENYALGVTRRNGTPEPGYLVGSWLVLYLAWLGGTLVGVLFGALIPPGWERPLQAVFPLVFLVLTVLLSRTVPLAIVALLGAVLAVLGVGFLPTGWHVIAAGLLASLAGPWLERRFGGRTRP